MTKITTLVASTLFTLSGVTLSGVVLAGAVVIDDTMTRRGPDTVSGDKVSTVEANCATDPSGYDWQLATAELMVRQVGGGSTVDIEVENAAPNTVFTVWLRIKGGSGFNDAGSPLTGGGATPLAPGSALDGLNDYSPWGAHPAGSANPTNGFVTNKHGDGMFSIDLDFPIKRGAYPFHLTSTSRPGHESHANVPTAIADPTEGTGGPFLIRVISHCTDGLGHGLSPGIREAWFQYP